MLNDNGKDGFEVGSLLVSSLKGMLFGAALTLLLSLVCSAIALAFADPNAAVSVLAYVVLAISSFFVGFGAVRSDGERRVISALVGGAMYVLLLWLVSLFVRTEGAASPLWTAIAYAVCIGVCMLGGIAANGRRVRIGEGKNSPSALMRRKIGTRK